MNKIKKPFYKKWWVWVIAVVIVLATIGGINGDETSTTSAKPSVSNTTTTPSTATVTKVEEKALVVSAETLAAAFDENEIKGNKLYKDKLVEVKGKISDIGEVLGSTYIVLSDGQEYSILGVQCSFSDKAQIEKIADLKKGDIVTVVGKVDGLSMNVSVDDCKFK